MKKALASTALLVIPSYLVFSWIYVFNAFADKSQAEKVAIYQRDFIHVNIDFVYLSLLGIVASAVAVVLLIKGGKADSTSKVNVFRYVLAAFSITLLLLLIWGIL